jgi:hypothetical protein
MFAGFSSAAVLYNNGLPNQSNGADLNAFLEADNFALADASLVTLIRFWTLQESLSDYAGSTEYSIRQDDGGIPGTEVAFGSFVSTQTPTGQTTLGLNEYEHVGSVNISLNAGSYWLVLHNGPSSSEPLTLFYWAFAGDQSGDSQSWELALGGDAFWATNNAELAFELEGEFAPVPEPSTLVLMLSSLGAIGLIRRRMA